ncbi:hypothetical protein CRUP_015786, partial [Coryphaenoides rupestris]
SLESLDLSHNHLALIPAGLPRSLQNLSILHNALSHIPAFSFRHLRPGLRSLRLSHNALGDAGVSHVAFVGTYRSLTELHLDHNGLTAVPRIVRQFKNLQDLRLDGNHIRSSLCPGSLCVHSAARAGSSRGEGSAISAFSFRTFSRPGLRSLPFCPTNVAGRRGRVASWSFVGTVTAR